MTDDDCAEAARLAIAPLEALVDQYEELAVEEWNALDPPPDVDTAQEAALAVAQYAVDRGCDAPTMEERLARAIDGIEGDGEVGRALAAALRGDGPLVGPPMPVIETTIARDEIPTTVTIEPGDSLPEILDRVAPHSTIRFSEGVYEFSESIVVDIDLEFEGVGRDRTILSSSAEGVAIAFVGPGGFSLRDMTVEHVGDKAASVLIAIEGPITVEDTTISGGVVGSEDAGGGHGIVFAYDNLPGFPERSDDERDGRLLLERTTISDNEAAGVLSTGIAAPEMVDVTIVGNGGCGLCFTGASSGSVDDSVIEGNDIGLQASDRASPRLRTNRFVGNDSVGVSLYETASLSIIDSAIEENGRIGVQISGNASATIDNNTIRQHAVGVLVADTADVSLSTNGVVDHEIGIQAGGDSTVDATDNTVWLTTVAAISYGEESTGTVARNQIDRATEVGIQVIESSRVQIVDNIVKNEGAVGVSFVDDSSGAATGNDITSREVGIQIGGRATPSLAGNSVGGSRAVGILYADDAGGSAVENEVTGAGSVGVLVGGAATPAIERNELLRNTVGLVLRDSAAATVTANVIDQQTIGAQIVDRATPTIVGNTITNSLEAGALYGGSAGGTFDGNVLASNNNIGLQVGESADPVIRANEIRGEGVYGILFQDDGAAEFRGNRVIDYVVAVQVNNSADPRLYDNSFEEIALTNVVYADSSGGEASGNACTAGASAGISVAATANPNVGENGCTVSRAG